MTAPHDPSLLETFARETEPLPTEVQALRDRMRGRATQGLLAHLATEPSAREISTLRARLQARANRRRIPWVPALLFTVAMGAAAAVALNVIPLRPDRPLPPVVPAPLSAELSPESGAVVLPRLHLRPSGTGTLSGTTAAPRIDWVQGTLAVRVPALPAGEEPPAQEIVTREARIRFAVAELAVVRDVYGTRVDVAGGRAEVTCLAGGDHALGTGETTTCWPVSAPGLLARAKAMQEAGVPPAEVLATVDAALGRAEGPFIGELRAMRAEQLLGLGRPAEALAEARRYLDAGGTRTEVVQIAAAAAMETEGCAGALPFLERLEAAGLGDPDWLIRCSDSPTPPDFR